MKRLSFVLFMLSAALFLGALTGCSNQSPAGSNEPTQPPAETNPTGPYQFRSGELQNYVIVYDQKNPEYAQLANRLADHILNKYDQFLTTATHDSTPTAEYEILLGDTNRYTDQSRIMEYAVTVADGKFRIHAGGAFSAEKAITFLCDQLFTGKEFALQEGTYYQTSFLNKTQSVTENATGRIMSANILADAFSDNSYKKAPYRAEIFAGMLISYTPDVLGLQESDAGWDQVLESYLKKIEKVYGIKYARHLATYENKINYTSLLYRADKYKVETDGIYVFNWWSEETFLHNYHMRNISWAKFSPLHNPEEVFIVANTHWSYRTEHADGNTYLAGSQKPIAVNELRTQCKEETDAFLASLRQTYPETPVILTGDFNTSLSFFTDSGWTPQNFRIISQEAKNGGTAISLVPSAGHFDHLFGAGTYTIHLYGFFQDVNEHSLLTDHPFVYADFSF